MLSVCTHSGIMHTLHACLPAGRLCLHALCLESRKQKQVLLQRIKISSFVLPSPQTELTVPEDQSPFSFSFCPIESHCVIIQVISAFTVLHCVTLEDKNTQTFWLLATLQESMQRREGFRKVFACKWDWASAWLPCRLEEQLQVERKGKQKDHFCSDGQSSGDFHRSAQSSDHWVFVHICPLKYFLWASCNEVSWLPCHTLIVTHTHFQA